MSSVLVKIRFVLNCVSFLFQVKVKNDFWVWGRKWKEKRKRLICINKTRGCHRGHRVCWEIKTGWKLETGRAASEMPFQFEPRSHTNAALYLFISCIYLIRSVPTRSGTNAIRTFCTGSTTAWSRPRPLSDYRFAFILC